MSVVQGILHAMILESCIIIGDECGPGHTTCYDIGILHYYLLINYSLIQ